jgi:hypothetical protein
MGFRSILDATSSVVKDMSAECDFGLKKAITLVAPLELRTVVILPLCPGSCARSGIYVGVNKSLLCRV